MSQKALQITGLTKTYGTGVKALKGVDFEVEAGDFFSLLGANGAGKTTLIGIVTGTVNKSAGQVKVFGVDIDQDHNKAKEMIGLVPQEFNFNIFEKVLDIVVQQGGYFGIPRKKAIERAKPILEILDLWEKRDSTSMRLSGGMKRRLMIARALIHKPKLLILDEPTAGVDVELRREMWEYLKKLNAEGTTILLTTHYLEEAEALCKNVAVVKTGEIVSQGPMKEMLKSVEKQMYVVDVDQMKDGFDLKGFEWNKVDDDTVNVQIDKHQTINQMVNAFDQVGVTIRSLAPKTNRLEQLFLNLLEEQ